MAQDIPDPIADVTEALGTNYVGIASFTILIWDHIATFSDEVEYVWMGKKGPVVYLFLLNRYLTPFAFTVNLFAYFSPSWTPERCKHFIRYEGCATAIAIEIVGLMMLLRINVLYNRHRWIPGGLLLLLLIETGMNMWLISRGEAVVHNKVSGVHSCTMIFDPAISAAASSSAWIPLLYDSIVFGLTLHRTIPSIRKREAGYIVKRLFEDGLLYYSVIFTVTLVLTIMIVAAPPGLKNITAQVEQLITVAMMSRITLSLKKAGSHGQTEFVLGPKSASFHQRHTSFDLFPNTSPNSRITYPRSPKLAPVLDIGTNLRFARSARQSWDSPNSSLESSRESYELQNRQPNDRIVQMQPTSIRYQPPGSW